MKKILLLSLLLLGATTLPFGHDIQAQNTKSAKAGKNLPTVDGSNPQGAASTATSKTLALPEPEVGLDIPLRHALKSRASVRQFRDEDLSPETLSGLLWSAYGLNRPEEGKRVVPSAANCQEYDIYAFTRDGIYLYDATGHTLQLVATGDHRAQVSSQQFFASAPLVLVLVANYDRMSRFKAIADRDNYAAIDCGYISQNIYLYCAATELGTVACGNINRDYLNKELGIKNGRAMLAHPVGAK